MRQVSVIRYEYSMRHVIFFNSTTHVSGFLDFHTVFAKVIIDLKIEEMMIIYIKSLFTLEEVLDLLQPFIPDF